MHESGWIRTQSRQSNRSIGQHGSLWPRAVIDRVCSIAVGFRLSAFVTTRCLRAITRRRVHSPAWSLYIYIGERPSRNSVLLRILAQPGPLARGREREDEADRHPRARGDPSPHAAFVPHADPSSPRTRGSILTPHASRLTPYALRLTPYASRLTPYASRLTPHASRLTPYASRLTPHVIPTFAGTTGASAPPGLGPELVRPGRS